MERNFKKYIKSIKPLSHRMFMVRMRYSFFDKTFWEKQNNFQHFLVSYCFKTNFLLFIMGSFSCNMPKIILWKLTLNSGKICVNALGNFTNLEKIKISLCLQETFGSNLIMLIIKRQLEPQNFLLYPTTTVY